MKISELVSVIEKFKNEDIERLSELVKSRDQVLMIGNGGSNSICSHISQDYTKQLGKKAFAFSDPSRLTCYINDYGMEAAYAQFIQEFAKKDDLVILISSSGNSDNIVRATSMCISMDIDFVILTGFDEDNRVRSLYGDKSSLDIWVDSYDYGVVECAHQIFLHAIVGE